MGLRPWLEDKLQVEHDHAVKESKRSVDQAVRSDTARRQAQDNLRRYLEARPSHKGPLSQLTCVPVSTQVFLSDAYSSLQ